MHVGITGHQRLKGATAWPWVQEVLEQLLDDFERPLVGVSSLAIGADQLLAGLVLERGGALHVVIPFAGYEGMFTGKDLETYRRLLELATVEVLAVSGSAEDAYLAAGKRMVEIADIMLAVWNGKPARGVGGTADVVMYARDKGKTIIQVNPDSRSVERP